ncbi:hypothetical protein D3C84_1263800 [compost metagenome]
MWCRRWTGAQANTWDNTPGVMSTLECCNSNCRLMANASSKATSSGIPNTIKGKNPTAASSIWCSGCFIKPLKP